jgi:hypothetical protein
MVDGVRGLLEKTGGQAGDYAKLCLYAPDKRSHGGAVRKLKLDPAQVQEVRRLLDSLSPDAP